MMQNDVMKNAKIEIVGGLGFAAVMLALAFAAKIAHEHGYIDGDTALRTLAMNGLLIAWLGNRIPKKMAPSACARQAMRFSGWSQVLAGLTYTALWLFAPIRMAEVVGTGVVVASVVATLSYCVWLHNRSRASA